MRTTNLKYPLKHQEGPYDCIIIGAGPSGLMAGIRSSELGKKTLILEKMHHPGLKLLISGKGRCNITNIKEIDDFIEAFGKNGRFLYGAFSKFFSQDLLAFFKSRGLDFNIERGGRVFPKTNKSSTILNCLLSELKKLGAELLTASKVIEIETTNNKVEGVILENKKTIKGNSVIIACGGMSYPLTGSTGDGFWLAKKLGHTVTPLKPSLVGLLVREKIVLDWQGVSLKNVEISLYENKSLRKTIFGEMLFTHFGISGPIVLTISKTALLMLDKKSETSIYIDFKPALTKEQLDERFLREFKIMGSKIFKNYLTNLLPSKMISGFIKLSGIKADKKICHITKAERLKIIDLLKSFKLTITGSRPIGEAIVTSGGISINEINPKTMESKLIKGLFFAGEVIDIDAISGGYNLQAAFSTGFIAGENA